MQAHLVPDGGCAAQRLVDGQQEGLAVLVGGSHQPRRILRRRMLMGLSNSVVGRPRLPEPFDLAMITQGISMSRCVMSRVHRWWSSDREDCSQLHERYQQEESHSPSPHHLNPRTHHRQHLSHCIEQGSQKCKRGRTQAGTGRVCASNLGCASLSMRALPTIGVILLSLLCHISASALPGSATATKGRSACVRSAQGGSWPASRSLPIDAGRGRHLLFRSYGRSPTTFLSCARVVFCVRLPRHE